MTFFFFSLSRITFNKWQLLITINLRILFKELRFNSRFWRLSWKNLSNLFQVWHWQFVLIFLYIRNYPRLFFGRLLLRSFPTLENCYFVILSALSPYFLFQAFKLSAEQPVLCKYQFLLLSAISLFVILSEISKFLYYNFMLCKLW